MKECRKDCSPKETVKKIKNILRDNHIPIKEYPFKNLYNKFYSVRIEIKGFYHIGTNGKGLTKELALASAYAELMERLQSRMLINTYYLNKISNHFSFLTEKKDFSIIESNPDLLLSFFRNKNSATSFLMNNPKYQIVDTYHDLLTNQIVYLPSKLINTTTFSNGLCAGNTYYEAINQGLCEIFERYVYHEILTNKTILSNIEIDSSLYIYSRIQYLKSFFNISIKDCSLGIYPVVGVYITNFENTQYIFTVGSDPNIDVAIQRCLTEAFQGLNCDEELLSKMKPIHNAYDHLSNDEKHINWLQNYISNNGIHPESIMKSKDVISYREFKCFTNSCDNESLYDFLLSVIKNNHLSIYVKDFSYLGFPTYKVFVPKLSNVELIEDYEIDLLKYHDFLKEVYFNLNSNYEFKKLKKCSHVLKDILKYKKYSFLSLGNYFHATSFLNSDFSNITFELFYVLIQLKIHESVNFKVIQNEKLLQYLQDNMHHLSYNFLIKDLGLLLPSCPNCHECSLRRKCRFKHWKKINEQLLNKEKAFLNQ